MDKHISSARLPSVRSTVRTFLVLVLIAGGALAGMYWHAPLEQWLGLQKEQNGPAATGEPSGKQLWSCGMHPQVIQDHPGDCPICHMKLTPLKVDGGDAGSMNMPAGEMSGMSSSSAPTGGQRKIKYYWDPMLSPPYISDKPGKSPMGIELIPVYEDQASRGAGITIDPTVVQNMGLRVANAEEGPLRRTIRAVGYLDEAQPNIHDVNLRVNGWIEKLYADTEGMHVEKGDPLFDLYSPEVVGAVDELIIARRAKTGQREGLDETIRKSANDLYEAAIQKLVRLGLEREQIEALAKLDRAPRTITFASPITGHVTEKMVVAGAAVKMGDRVLRIVDHSMLWLDVKVFEQQLPFVKLGQRAAATIAGVSRTIDGEIIFIHPHVDPMTRTAMVRFAIPNPSLELRPGMYATVRIIADLADRTVIVPREGIIDSGEKQLVFVVQGGGRFEPRRVMMGMSGDEGMVQVLDGLAPGEPVVISGQFLLDSESRIREAIQKFLSEKEKMGSQSQAAPMGPSMPGMEMQDSHNMSTSTTSAPIAVSPSSQPKFDALLSAYLEIVEKLGRMQTADAAVDVSKFVASAHALHGTVRGTELEKAAVELAKSGEALSGKTIGTQRELFKRLSENVARLADVAPPSTALGKLYRMHCPMAPGDWLQRNDKVANPFYATEMKECGSLVKVIVPRKGASK